MSKKSEQKRLTQQLAWVYNQALPVYPVADQFGNYFLDRDGWNLPSKDDPTKAISNPGGGMRWQIAHGLVTPKN